MIFSLCVILYAMFKSVVLNLFSTGPHYGPSASLTAARMPFIY